MPEFNIYEFDCVFQGRQPILIQSGSSTQTSMSTSGTNTRLVTPSSVGRTQTQGQNKLVIVTPQCRPTVAASATTGFSSTGSNTSAPTIVKLVTAPSTNTTSTVVGAPPQKIVVVSLPSGASATTQVCTSVMQTSSTSTTAAISTASHGMGMKSVFSTALSSIKKEPTTPWA